MAKKKQSFKHPFLVKMQERQDKAGYTLYFAGGFGVTQGIKPKSINEALRRALAMEPTVKTSSLRRQSLGSSRSLQDMYLLCKHYFPSCTIFEVVEELKAIDVKMFYCYQFNKMMFKKHSRYEYRYLMPKHIENKYFNQPNIK